MKRSQVVPYIIILLLLLLLAYRELFRKPSVDVEKVKAHTIKIEDAAAYTKAFTAAKAELKRQLKDSSFLDRSFNLPASEMFNSDAIASMLNQKEASGIRIYLGLNEKREVCFVMVPVTKDGKDIQANLLAVDVLNIPGISKAMADFTKDALAVERGVRCPHICDFTSVLSN